jgi:regulator of cell morphogenesis and NO signaling
MAGTIKHRVDPSATVAALVLEHPSAARSFERFGIDFCCRGRVALEAACRELGIPLSQVLEDLERELHAPGPTAPSNTDVGALIDYILERHHRYASEELTRLRPLASKVEQAHGERHHELREVREVVEAICDDLLPHMRKEELVLFPLLRARARDPQLGAAPQGPISVMQREHDQLGSLLLRLRALTSGYSAPRDACTSYQVLYRGLEQLSADLHQHIHLENNLLFPLAEEVDRSRR